MLHALHFGMVSKVLQIHRGGKGIGAVCGMFGLIPQKVEESSRGGLGVQGFEAAYFVEKPAERGYVGIVVPDEFAIFGLVLQLHRGTFSKACRTASGQPRDVG